MSVVEERRLVIFVIAFSVVSSFKSLFFNNNVFNAQDCFGAAITISLIIYMEIYRDKEGYDQWINKFKNLSKNLGIWIMGLFLVLLVWGFESISELLIGNGGIKFLNTFFYFVSNFLSYTLLTLGICLLIMPFLRFLSVKLDKDEVT